MKTLRAAVILALLAARPSAAQTPACDALHTAHRALARDLLARLHPYDGCDETFERCLAAQPPAPVVVRLASDLCRHIAAGKDAASIERALAKRAQSMLPVAKPAQFTLDDATRAGADDAPVSVVVYACARCPFCKVLVPALYRAVTEGPLRGKVKLHYRPFPLKYHAGSLEGGLAMMSAAKLGRFWPFILELYGHYDLFCPQRLPQWAEAAGLDRAAFERELADPAARAALVASKQEGLRHRVDATPTLFIDGRRYVYEMRLEAVIDVLEEAGEAAGKGGPQP